MTSETEFGMYTRSELEDALEDQRSLCLVAALVTLILGAAAGFAVGFIIGIFVG